VGVVRLEELNKPPEDEKYLFQAAFSSYESGPSWWGCELGRLGGVICRARSRLQPAPRPSALHYGLQGVKLQGTGPSHLLDIQHPPLPAYFFAGREAHRQGAAGPGVQGAGVQAGGGAQEAAG